MSELAPLGSPPRFVLNCVPRKTYVVVFEYDGWTHSGPLDEPEAIPARKSKGRSFYSETAAYRWLARRMIFVRRDRFAKKPYPKADPTEPNCTLCKIWFRHGDMPEGFCRYHDSESFHRIEKRLARWLKWRDARRPETA